MVCLLIISSYGRQAFDIMENFINVTIPFNYDKGISEEILKGIKIILTQAEKAVIEEINNNPHITIRELVTTTGYSDGYVRKVLTQLKEKGVVQRRGGRKEGTWIVMNDVI